MAQKKRKQKVQPRKYGNLFSLKDTSSLNLPLEFSSLIEHDLLITNCKFNSLPRELILAGESMRFCPQSEGYSRQRYLSTILGNKDFLEKAKETIEREKGIFFIFNNYEVPELSNYYFVKEENYKHQIKFAFGSYVSSWIAHLIVEVLEKASVNYFPIIDYSPINQITKANPASLYLVNLTKSSIY